jgi:endonuclease YncB( thermonuclease family)
VSTLRPFVYWALIDRVTDGDTLHAAYIDLGLGVKWFGPTGTGVGVRLLGCNAAEKGTAAGRAARDALYDLVLASKADPWLHVDDVWVKLATAKPDAYQGRLDAQVQLEDGTDLTEWLIANQHAAPWNGKDQPRPVPPWPRAG